MNTRAVWVSVNTRCIWHTEYVVDLSGDVCAMRIGSYLCRAGPGQTMGRMRAVYTLCIWHTRHVRKLVR